MQQLNNVQKSLLETRTLPSNAQHLAHLRQYVQDGLHTEEEARRLAQGQQAHQPFESKRQFRSPIHAG